MYTKLSRSIRPLLSYFHLFILIHQVLAQRQQHKPLVHFSHRPNGSLIEPGLNDNEIYQGNETNTVMEHLSLSFSEVELERLCPSNIDTLKTIPKGITCKSGNLDFWLKTCRCYYVKSLVCPSCPDNPMATPAPLPTQTTLPNAMPHLLLSNAQQFNASMIFHKPNGEEEENATTVEFSAPNRVRIFNAAGGIVNLYFYNTGQQVITSAVENDLTNTSTNQSLPNANAA